MKADHEKWKKPLLATILAVLYPVQVSLAQFVRVGLQPILKEGESKDFIKRFGKRLFLRAIVFEWAQNPFSPSKKK